MQNRLSSLRTFAAAAALFAVVGSAQADMTFFSSQADYLSYLDRPVTDDFSDLSSSLGAQLNGPQRQAGSFGYGIYSYEFLDGFPDYVTAVGSLDNPQISTWDNWSTLIMDKFTGGANAFGINVWGQTGAGAFVPGQTIEFEVVDSTGADQYFHFTPTDTGDGSFVGVISNGTIKIVNLTVVVNPNLLNQPFVTADNVTLGQATVPVPEPTSYALMLAGLAALGAVVRRRRKA